MLKAIVFDFDGVIVDSEPLHYRAFLRIGKTLGADFTYEEYLDKYIGFDDRDAFRAMLGKPTGRAGNAADEKKIHELIESKADAFEAVVNEGIETIPGMVDLIKQAGAALPIAIASGATRRDIDLILKKLGLSQMFQTIITADLVEASKPDPASYRLAVKALVEKHPGKGVSAGECLAIEDTAAGIESARGAGLMTLGLASTGPTEKLHRANRVITSAKGLTLDELSKWFG